MIALSSDARSTGRRLNVLDQLQEVHLSLGGHLGYLQMGAVVSDHLGDGPSGALKPVLHSQSDNLLVEPNGGFEVSYNEPCVVDASNHDNVLQS